MVPKTKTISILKTLESSNYKRVPQPEILTLSKIECKALIVARFGMLECGVNFRGTTSYRCTNCNTDDSEEHRLNHCIKYRENNCYDMAEKNPFKLIYSNDPDVLRVILKKIDKVWNVTMGQGSMR